MFARVHGVPPYEFERRARPIGRVAPSRMKAQVPRMQAFGAGSTNASIRHGVEISHQPSLLQREKVAGVSLTGVVPHLKEKLLCHKRGSS